MPPFPDKFLIIFLNFVLFLNGLFFVAIRWQLFSG